MTYRPYSAIIAQAQTGGTSALSYMLENTSGLPISRLIPVCTSSTGGFKRINVSSETDALSLVGVTSESVLNATEGNVVAKGRIQDIGDDFALNSTVWVSKSGGLAVTAPDVGVGGFAALDFVIRVGKVVKNQTDPLKKDLLVNMSLIGQL